MSDSARETTKNGGQIQVILGPMFSGKSSELLRRVKRYDIAKHECILIKSARDTRYSEKDLSTHDGKQDHELKVFITKKLSEVDIPAECSVIGIDEGQFFPDIVDFCETMANDGHIVIVAALDGTHERKAFGSVLSLIPLAESVVKLNAVCMLCHGEAAFTMRTSKEREVVVIGGAEKYEATCRRCFHRKLPEPSLQ